MPVLQQAMLPCVSSGPRCRRRPQGRLVHVPKPQVAGSAVSHRSDFHRPVISPHQTHGFPQASKPLWFSLVATMC